MCDNLTKQDSTNNSCARTIERERHELRGCEVADLDRMSNVWFRGWLRLCTYAVQYLFVLWFGGWSGQLFVV